MSSAEAVIRKLEAEKATLEQANQELARELVERERVDASLRESEEKYRLSFEAAPVGISLLMPDGRVMAANRWILDLTGCSLDDLQSEGFATLSAHPNEFQSLLTRLPIAEPVRDVEMRLRRRDGTTVDALININSIILGSQSVLLTTVRDTGERREAEGALRTRDERHRAFIAHSSEAIWCLELESPVAVALPADEQIRQLYQHGRVAEANTNMALLHGFASVEDVTGKRLGQILPRLSRLNVDLLKAFIHAGYRLTEVESREMDQQGRIKFFQNSLLGIVEGGLLTRVWVVKRDISDRKAFELEIRRLNRLYAVLSQVNQAIVRVGSRAELFTDICRVAIEFGRFKLAWIGWLDAATGAVQLVAQAGDAQGFLERLDLTAGDRSSSGDIAWTAMRTGLPNVVDDVSREAPQSWREVALAHGFHAAGAFPFHQNNAACGVLVIYADEPGFFQDVEVKLLEEVAQDISFALDALDRDAQRRRAEDALERAVSQLQATLESTADGILVVDPSGRVINFNERFAQLWRLPTAIVESRDERAMLSFVSEQLRDPGEFSKKVQELYGQPDSESLDVLEFKDGRVFERYSRPQRIDGHATGRVWSFRDITERRQAEAKVSEQLEELRRWHDATLGREGRVLELKKEVNELLAQADHPPRYPSAEEERET